MSTRKKVQEIDYSKNGALLSPPDVRAYKGVATACAQNLPKTFKLEAMPIKNQGVVNSCVAHACSSVVEYFNKKETGTYVRMSTGFIYGNRRNTFYKGEGMYMSKALSNLRHYGTTKAEDFDNNKEVPDAINIFEDNYEKFKDRAYENRITSYYRLYNTASMKAALYQGSPLLFALKCRAKMEVKDGVWIIDETSAYEGSHCMYIYGWNETGWLVANSWGTWFGKSGKVVLPYEYKLAEVYAVEDTFDAGKVNKDITNYEIKLKALRADYLQLFIQYGPELDATHQKEADKIEAQMNDIEKKIQALQKQLVDVEKPFDKCKWLGNIINAIIQFFWRIFHKE